MRRLLVVLLLVAGVGLVARDAVPCEAFALQARCYVALHPGPAQDSLALVNVGEQPSYASAGELLFTTVSVDTSLDFGEWLRSSVSPRTRAVRRDVLYPPGTGEEEVNRRNLAEMDRSQVTAAAAALRHLGHDVDLEPDGAEVVETASDAVPLRPGDILTAVDGTTVRTAEEALDALASRPPGERVELDIRRGHATRRIRARLRADPDDPGAGSLPVVMRDHVEFPVDVGIRVEGVGGPSAGLMFALAVIDALTPDDLTGGTVVAGTGAINADGQVSAVGGIQQKILGALERDEHRPATVFLAPTGDVREASGTPVERDILVVPVDTLEEALDVLAAVRAGERPPDAVALRS